MRAHGAPGFAARIAIQLAGHGGEDFGSLPRGRGGTSRADQGIRAPMNRREFGNWLALGLIAVGGAAAIAQKTAPTDIKTAAATGPKQVAGAVKSESAAGFPNGGESLTYSLNWPGGAALGEAHLKATKTGDGWDFDFTLEAKAPGFAIRDHYHSRADAHFCSLELEKETSHGQRKTHEKTVFDYHAGSATRTTLTDGGGHTDIDINNCAHDGLDYIYFARHELGQ